MQAPRQPGGMSDADGADTFGVAIGVSEDQLRVLVQVPTDIDSGWSDHETFQRLVAEVVWERLDREATLRAVVAVAEPGEKVPLGTVTLRPDGEVVAADLAAPQSS